MSENLTYFTIKDMAEFKDLEGKILINIERVGNEELIFTCTDGSKYLMHHQQNCCEEVKIEDVNGDLNELINDEILVADEKTYEHEISSGSETFIFYTIRTFKTSVDIRWCGRSNGCYSERVDFTKISGISYSGYLA